MENKREEYVIKIGPLLMNKLMEQRELIKEVTWDAVNASYYEAGEIIAKKVKL